MRTKILVTTLVITALSGCANQRYTENYPQQYPNQYPHQHSRQYPDRQPNTYPQYHNQYQNQQNYGELATIVGMRNIAVDGNVSGAGTMVGALVGGVLGHQVGKGTGNDLATIGGAIAGGIVGNQMERGSAGQKMRTELTVQFPNGETRTMLIDNHAGYRVGDRIRVTTQNGQLVPMQ